MLRKLVWILVAVVFVGIVVTKKYPSFRVSNSVRPSTPEVPFEALPAPPTAAGEQKPQSADPAPQAAKHSTGGVIAGVVAPRQEDVFEQVKANPHQTPRLLLEFSKAFIPQMEEAMKNEGAAKTLSADFSECVLDDALPIQIRNICLLKYFRLARKHASLKEPLAALRKRAPQFLSDSLKDFDEQQR